MLRLHVVLALLLAVETVSYDDAAVVPAHEPV